MRAPVMTESAFGSSQADTRRYSRDTLAFSRVANLSDAVFAIAMTLLVLTLDVPDVPAPRLTDALVAQVPQLVAFALGFGLVANLWWQHHKLVQRLAALEPGLIGINLALLGMVALVPFPTSLVGSAPTARAAVLPFVGVFIGLSVLYLLLVIRAHTARAWAQPVSVQELAWLVMGWVSGIVVMLVAMGVAWWRPVGGLIILAVTVVLGPLAARWSSAAYPLRASGR